MRARHPGVRRRAADQMARETAEGPEAVAATLAELYPRRDDVADLLASARRIMVVATGASLAMCRTAAPAWRRRLAVGAELVVRQSAEAALGDLDGVDVRDSDVMVAVSQSGTSPETLASARQGRGAGAAVISLTAHEASPLAELASLVVPLRCGEERDASTKSALATLAALYALAGALPATRESAGRLELQLAGVAGDERAVSSAAGVLAAARRVWLLGFGSALGLAEAGALLWHEKVIRGATAATPSEFRHGLIEAAGPEDAVVLVDVDAAERARTMYLGRLRDELATLDVPLVEVSREAIAGALSGRGCPIRIGGPVGPEAALEALLRLQQLAHATAKAAGTYRDGFAVLRQTVLPASDVFGETPIPPD